MRMDPCGWCGNLRGAMWGEVGSEILDGVQRLIADIQMSQVAR
jgi:hypothetical protein